MRTLTLKSCIIRYRLFTKHNALVIGWPSKSWHSCRIKQIIVQGNSVVPKQICSNPEATQQATVPEGMGFRPHSKHIRPKYLLQCESGEHQLKQQNITCYKILSMWQIIEIKQIIHLEEPYYLEMKTVKIHIYTGTIGVNITFRWKTNQTKVKIFILPLGSSHKHTNTNTHAHTKIELCPFCKEIHLVRVLAKK